MTNTPRPSVRPLTEGYVVKGGHNPGTSQIQTRPAAPAPIPAPKHLTNNPPSEDNSEAKRP